jgi:hypothetical protein
METWLIVNTVMCKLLPSFLLKLVLNNLAELSITSICVFLHYGKETSFMSCLSGFFRGFGCMCLSFSLLFIEQSLVKC